LGGPVYGILIKFCSEKEHAEDLLDGTLYCNRLSWFRQLEGDTDRGDPYEGQRMRHVARSGAIDVQMRTLNPDIDDLALFCMSLPHAQRETDVAARLEESLAAFLEMGRHAVVIDDVDAFIDRLAVAAKREEYNVRANLVRYYKFYPEISPDDLTQSWKPVFLKHARYASQHEYRIAIHTAKRDTSPLRVNIGSIRDIARYVPTEALLKSVAGSSERLRMPRSEVDEPAKEEERVVLDPISSALLTVIMNLSAKLGVDAAIALVETGRESVLPAGDDESMDPVVDEFVYDSVKGLLAAVKTAQEQDPASTNWRFTPTPASESPSRYPLVTTDSAE